MPPPNPRRSSPWPGKKAKPQTSAYDEYLFEIEGKTSSYSLGSGVPRYETGLYSQYWHMEFPSLCLAPAKVAGRQTNVLIIAQRVFFVRPKYVEESWRPLGVAHLTMRGSRSDVSCSVPYDAAWGIANSIATGFFKYLRMSGERLSRGKAHMSYLTFAASYDRRDYFDEETES